MDADNLLVLSEFENVLAAPIGFLSCLWSATLTWPVIIKVKAFANEAA